MPTRCVVVGSRKLGAYTKTVVRHVGIGEICIEESDEVGKEGKKVTRLERAGGPSLIGSWKGGGIQGKANVSPC